MGDEIMWRTITVGDCQDALPVVDFCLLTDLIHEYTKFSFIQIILWCKGCRSFVEQLHGFGFKHRHLQLLGIVQTELVVLAVVDLLLLPERWLLLPERLLLERLLLLPQ
jgi:hypothetical protein